MKSHMKMTFTATSKIQPTPLFVDISYINRRKLTCIIEEPMTTETQRYTQTCTAMASTANAFTLQFMSISTLHRNVGTSHHPK